MWLFLIVFPPSYTWFNVPRRNTKRYCISIILCTWVNNEWHINSIQQDHKRPTACINTRLLWWMCRHIVLSADAARSYIFIIYLINDARPTHNTQIYGNCINITYTDITHMQALCIYILMIYIYFLDVESIYPWLSSIFRTWNDELRHYLTVINSRYIIGTRSYETRNKNNRHVGHCGNV